jgi:hypothetical protein
MLGYRSYFTVNSDGPQDVLEGTTSQLYTWLRSKRYDADAVRPGSVGTIGDGVEAAMTTHIDKDGSESLLFQLRETRSAGTWTTQVLAHQPRSDRRQPWVWLDIDTPDPDGRRANVPRLARGLLEVLDARDAGAHLSPAAHVIGHEDVPSLVAALSNENRRGPVFLAGSDETLPLEPWRQLTSDLLRETTGIAAGYLLDSGATKEFARIAGPTHAVEPGTLRTFARGVDFGDNVDARRHRILTTNRILNESGRRVVRMLGQRAREATLAKPLPPQALRVEERLLRQADEDFLRKARNSPIAPPEAISAVTQKRKPSSGPSLPETREALQETADAISESGAITRTSPTKQESKLLAALKSVTQTVFGPQSVTPDAIAELGRLAQDATSLRALQQRMRHENENLQERVTELRSDIVELGKRLEDEQAEHALTTEELADKEANLQAIRLRMQQQGQGEAAWAPLEEDEKPESAPGSFDELLTRMEDLQHVIWTGDDDVAADLDAKDPLGRWASQAWKALRALDDYVAWRKDGHSGSIDHYLSSTPQGMQGFSANRHASDETNTVRSTRKYSAPRMLAVPRSVDPSGTVFMGAHFKIAQSGTTSPRLHYYDAYEADATIYVGYIGPHLVSPRTN